MIKLEKTTIYGWEESIRGMRNPMNSWEKSDSDYRHFLGQKCEECGKYELSDDNSCDGCWINDYEYPYKGFAIGPNDHELMMKLTKSGPTHAKFRRMIVVYVDITAPLYWWKEFDTYKVGTVANSCSTMHKIHDKRFTSEDFSCEKLLDDCRGKVAYSAMDAFKLILDVLDRYRMLYLETKDKVYWDQMIQLLPSSYNQKRTIELNYEVLAGIYPMRKNHKLDEWREFCKWIEELPYSEVITGGKNDET